MDHAIFQFKDMAAGRISGLAAGYGNVDSHGETFAPGAFKESLATNSRRVAMLLHHRNDRPVGKWDGLKEGADGLYAEGTLALDAKDGQEAYALAKAGALTGLSVGFIRKDDGRGKLITKADLYEISLVAVPSNPLTYLGDVKGAFNLRELEDHLREIGIPRSRARVAALEAFRAADEAKDDLKSAAAMQRLAASTSEIAKIMEI